jgi:mono/diheme cytochrome c family protein
MIRRNASWIGIGVLVVIVLIAVVGFGGNSSNTDAGNTGIAAQDPDLVAAGEPLYQANCASCHGIDLKGTDKGPSHLSVVYEPNHHGDIAFVLAAQNGVRAHHWPFGDMAPVPGLSDQDLDAIVAYVRENQRIMGFEPYPS